MKKLVGLLLCFMPIVLNAMDSDDDALYPFALVSSAPIEDGKIGTASVQLTASTAPGALSTPLDYLSSGVGYVASAAVSVGRMALSAAQEAVADSQRTPAEKIKKRLESKVYPKTIDDVRELEDLFLRAPGKSDDLLPVATQCYERGIASRMGGDAKLILERLVMEGVDQIRCKLLHTVDKMTISMHKSLRKQKRLLDLLKLSRTMAKTPSSEHAYIHQVSSHINEFVGELEARVAALGGDSQLQAFVKQVREDVGVEVSPDPALMPYQDQDFEKLVISEDFIDAAAPCVVIVDESEE